MPGQEIFPNPTVKKVIFQIKYPNLFSIEKYIGDFQLQIMEKFPISSLGLRRQIVFADVGPNIKVEPPEDDEQSNMVQKIWQFRSGNGVVLNITSNSLDLSSDSHKTYNYGEDKDNWFRDTIQFVLERFLGIVRIPKLTRIGLRYIDECPVASAENEIFAAWYNTAFPLGRFNLQDVPEMVFKTRVRKGEFFLVYGEQFGQTTEKPVLVLDFDGYAENIESSEYLSVTDKLHDIIDDEYNLTIKEPVRAYMRRGEDSDSETNE